MPKIVERIQKMWNPPDDEYEDMYEEEATEPSADTREEQAAARRSFTSSSSNRVVNINRARAQVVVFKPNSFRADTNTIADEINHGNIVIVNFEETNVNEARYILAFLSGASYANHGDVKPVAARTYMFTPSGVNMSGAEIRDDLAQNGVTF